MENNYYENDEFDKSQFYDLFREIKNEIKDKVISKLLLTVQNQYNELIFLRKENISLKKHLSYILKRIILHKNECKHNSNNQNSLNKSSISIKQSLRNNSSANRRSQKYMNPLKNRKNEKISNYFSPKNKNTLNDSNDNSDNELNQINTIYINKKVNRYLNNINKKEISNNLNKTENIYTELFDNNQNKSINLEENYMNSENFNLYKDYNSRNNRDKNYKINTFTIKNKKSNYGEKIKAKKDLLYMKKAFY